MKWYTAGSNNVNRCKCCNRAYNSCVYLPSTLKDIISLIPRLSHRLNILHSKLFHDHEIVPQLFHGPCVMRPFT